MASKNLVLTLLSVVRGSSSCEGAAHAGVVGDSRGPQQSSFQLQLKYLIFFWVFGLKALASKLSSGVTSWVALGPFLHEMLAISQHCDVVPRTDT